MRGSTLRIVISWWMLIVHSAAMISSPFFLIDFESALDLILIMLPLTGLYVGIIVNFYSQNISGDPGTDRVSKQFVSLTIFFVAAFGIMVVGLQIMYYYGRIESLEVLKRGVGVVDTGIGVYTGLLLKPLFGK